VTELRRELRALRRGAAEEPEAAVEAKPKPAPKAKRPAARRKKG